jgi:tetratricopeptide (TPR) repeat protein
MRTILLTLLAAVVWSLPAYAETTVILKDGRRLAGQVIESSDTVGVVTAEGLQTVRRADIDRIEYDAFGKASRAQLAAYRAAERAADRVAHPAEAIVIWKEYLDRNQADNPLAAEADKQLLRWQEAVKDGKLVWAGKLVTPQDRERLRQQASLKLEQAVAAYRAGQLDRALTMLRDADRDWPGHPGVAFYTALALQKNRKPQDAARLYRQILENYPDHVPTLNNLAVSECLQRQFAVGVPLMLRALTLGGDVVLINDNAWKTLARANEARLRGFEGEVAKMESILSRFETVMQQQGLYRWGSAWIPAEKFKNIEAANREIDEKLKTISLELTVLRQEIPILQARVDELARQRRSAPSEYDVIHGIDTNADGTPDYFYPRDTLTKEKISLILSDHLVRLAEKQATHDAKLAEANALKEARLEPKVNLDYVLIEEAGDELLAGVLQSAPPAVPLLPSYAGPSSVADIVNAIRSGRAFIVAQDGTYLGRIIADPKNPQSVVNTDGAYGSPTGEFSLANPNTRFTSKDGDQSIFNPAAAKPPTLFFDGNTLAYLTENQQLKPRVRLADVLAVLRGQ